MEQIVATPQSPDTLLAWLQDWYERHCDGDWEHGYGVSIETLDNPGWSVRIDLRGTALAGQPLTLAREDTSETDWFQYWIQDDVFHGAGGPRNLSAILLAFRDWVESQTGATVE